MPRIVPYKYNMRGSSNHKNKKLAQAAARKDRKMGYRVATRKDRDGTYTNYYYKHKVKK